MKHLKYIREYYKIIDTKQGKWKIKLKGVGDEIDLNDKDTKIKTGIKYNFLGISFTPRYNNSTSEYYTIVQKLNPNNINDEFPGWIIYSNNLKELKDNIRFKVKEYLEKMENGTLNSNNNYNNLKTFKLFLEYNKLTQDKIDYILDKISRNGIESLSDEEQKLLDAQKKGEVESDEALYKLTEKENSFEIESHYNKFKFIYKNTVSDLEEKRYYGTMFLPRLVTADGEIIEGDLKGYISEDVIGNVSTHFMKKGYTDFDFTEGLEHEYDSFIQEILIEMKSKK